MEWQQHGSAGHLESRASGCWNERRLVHSPKASDPAYPSKAVHIATKLFD